MSTVNKPDDPVGSGPHRDDDPTGVRDLLSSLPHPDPMPEHLVDRINASLAAEQSQRAARMSSQSVTPLLATARHRPRRLVLVVAGAAAAVALVAVVGNDIFLAGQPTTTSASLATTSNSQDSAGKEAASAEASTRSSADQRLLSGAQPSAAAGTPTLSAAAGTSVLVRGVFSGSSVQIVQSGTRYTRAGFAAQAAILHVAAPQLPQPQALSGAGPTTTGAGLMECLRAVGAGQAQVVSADVATYEGRPAVVIVTTTKAVSVAYVVDPQCPHATPAVLRQATSLP